MLFGLKPYDPRLRYFAAGGHRSRCQSAAGARSLKSQPGRSLARRVTVLISLKRVSRSLKQPGLRIGSDLIIESRKTQPVLVLRVGIVNRSAGLLELCLAEFHNRTESKLVAGLCQLQAQIRLLE
jgi:hypothetical protein